jgi:hypothetical protein
MLGVRRLRQILASDKFVISDDDSDARQREARAQVNFSNQVTLWLRHAGVNDEDARATLAVGIADVIHAMEVTTREFRGLLATDPSSEAGAEQALHHMALIGAYFFGEIKNHLEDMQRVWETVLEEVIAERLPPDSED